MVDYIRLNSPNYRFIFKAIAPIVNRVSQTVLPISLVNSKPQNNVLFRFTGQQEEYNVSFFIFNEGNDLSNGTAPAGDFPTGVITVDEQIDWLKNFIFNEDFDAKWYFTHERYAPTEINCVITDIQFNNEAGGASVVTATMTIRIGNVGNF